MRIRGLLNTLLPLGYQEIKSASREPRIDSTIKLPVPLLSSFFDSLSPPIMSDIDLAFYDPEALSRSLISYIHHQRSHHGIYASTSTDRGLESLAFVDLTSLLNFILDLQRRTLHLLSSDCQTSDLIVKKEDSKLESLYSIRDEEKDNVKIREQIPSLPSSIMDLCNPTSLQDYASQFALCGLGQAFQIAGNEGTDRTTLVLHSLLRMLSFSTHLEALWISTEPPENLQDSKTVNSRANIAKKASRIWEILCSRSLLNSSQEGGDHGGSHVFENSFTKLRPLERLALSSIPIGSSMEEVLGLVDSFLEAKNDEDEEMDELDSDGKKIATKSSLALVVIDSIDGILGSQNGKNELDSSIVEIGVGLVERARKSGMRIYILNSSSTSTEKNPSSTFESNTSQPSLGTLLSHSIDGTLSISLASSLIKSEQSEAQEDETKVRQLIAEKSESRKFYLKSLNKQTQTQTQTQTQRKMKVMKTFLIEKLEDGNDYKGVWGSYRSDGVDLFETREIE